MEKKNFKSYGQFCEWYYTLKLENQLVKNELPQPVEIHIDGEEVFYTSIMDCLHAHEEG